MAQRPALRHATREISYASSAPHTVGRFLIRAIENLSGRLRLIRRANGYEADVAGGADFWQVMLDRFGVTLDVVGGDLSNIPATGPLIVVSNHPYGILDGLVMGHILRQRRGDFRILANTVFRKAEEINRIILPISFDGTREAQKLNVETRKTALAYLAGGGAVGIFPGGTVSTSKTLMSDPMDPVWRGFTARMIAKSGATVVPVYFDGANSRLFQWASHLSPVLRLSLLIREFGARTDRPVRMVVGTPVDPAKLASLAADPKAMMDFLRRSTYELSPKPLSSFDYGFEFEEHHRN